MLLFQCLIHRKGDHEAGDERGPGWGPGAALPSLHPCPGSPQHPGWHPPAPSHKGAPAWAHGGCQSVEPPDPYPSTPGSQTPPEAIGVPACVPKPVQGDRVKVAPCHWPARLCGCYTGSRALPLSWRSLPQCIPDFMGTFFLSS